MLEFAANARNGEALLALPEPQKEVEKLPREYISNVVYTIVGAENSGSVSRKQ